MAVTVSGAAVTGVIDPASNPVPLTKDGYVLTQNGLYTFRLVNLLPGMTVSVTANGTQTTSKPGTKPVTAKTGSETRSFSTFPLPSTPAPKGS